jgi:hypothetical protein
MPSPKHKPKVARLWLVRMEPSPRRGLGEGWIEDKSISKSTIPTPTYLTQAKAARLWLVRMEPSPGRGLGEGRLHISQFPNQQYQLLHISHKPKVTRLWLVRLEPSPGRGLGEGWIANKPISKSTIPTPTFLTQAQSRTAVACAQAALSWERVGRGLD